MRKMEKEEFLIMLNSKNLALCTDFQFANNYTTVYCNKCNIHFYRTGSYLITEDFKCPICNSSKYFEAWVAPYLLNYGYVFHAYSNPNLKSIFGRVLEFDYAIFENPEDILNDLPTALVEVYEYAHFVYNGEENGN